RRGLQSYDSCTRQAQRKTSKNPPSARRLATHHTGVITMKFNHLALSAVCASLLLPGSAFAQQPAQPPVQVIDASGKVASVTASATIAAIDVNNRVVTLKGAQGNEFAVDVGNKVN